ncbi:TetR/AcrR family transcriptional regulator [Allokutzneria sp. NRRL B-24872]|uniref:TetR/AcrR family transcriptional regulator n=1 Tax=Allokutzneria sp. NRRL B-24872 TaxID=1137961 RepID=UPI000A383067|nr:TetR/AcrR family transcriptional regulator [Allokutzneria sp. NRRL B-24872]
MVRLTRAEQQRVTHDRLLGAGRAVFARRGFLAATVEEIVAEAGYTRGALYKHFGSREGLWLAITDAQAEDHLAELEKRLDGVADRDALVAALVPAGAVFGGGALRAVYEFTAWIAGQPEVAAPVIAAQRQREERITAMLERACSRLGVRATMPLAEVVVLVGALGGSLALRSAMDAETDVRAVATGVLEAVFAA